MQYRNYHARPYARFMAISLASLIGAASVWANPTGQQPERPLASHGTIAGASEKVTGLYKLYNEEYATFQQQYERREVPTKLSDRVIAKAAGRLWKARRDAEHLTLMGEPAGSALNSQLSPLFMAFSDLAFAYRSTPRGQQLVQKTITKLKRELPKLTKFLTQADGALQKGNLEIFEKLMEKKGIELHEQIIFLTASEKRPFIEPFNAVMGKGDTLLTRQRKQQYMEQAKQAMEKQIAPVALLSSETARIRREIASAGTATLVEGTTGGPAEAFAQVCKLWGNASAGLVRARAIVWAFTGRGEAKIEPSPSELQTTAIAELASVIDAAASSTPPDKVPQVYADLLKQITVMDRRLGAYSKAVSEGCEPAMKKLAAKDPALSMRIESYRRATSEPLKWRMLFASQHAKTLGNSLRQATSMMGAKTEVPSHKRPAYARAPNGKTVVAPLTLNAPAGWLAYEAAVRLVGKPVGERRMLRLTPTSRTAVVPFDSGHYGNVPVSLQSDIEVSDLKSAIVVDDTYGPLSVEAADAVSSAELHDYLMVAGPIREVHLEALVTRFIALPDVAYALAPVGRIMMVEDSVSPLQQACWRLDVDPVWAQNKYFTVASKGKGR